MPSYNDIRDFVEAQRRDRGNQRRNHLQAVVGVGRNAQIVLEHPAWQSYVDHVYAMKDGAEKEFKDTQAAMLDSDDTTLIQLRRQLMETRGRIKGYEQCLELIPELIKRAAEAASELGK